MKLSGKTGMREDGPWNYDDVYQYVKEDVEAADLALVTQETIFVEDREDVSGYPSFGTPRGVWRSLGKYRI